MTARCSPTVVFLLVDGTVVFSPRLIERCGLQEGGRVSLIFDEPRNRLVVHLVPGWMGGIRLTVQPAGMLAAEQALNFLFNDFEEPSCNTTYEAQWVAEGGFILVRIALRRKVRSETVKEMK